jgi:hypothetical protein
MPNAHISGKSVSSLERQIEVQKNYIDYLENALARVTGYLEVLTQTYEITDTNGERVNFLAFEKPAT